MASLFKQVTYCTYQNHKAGSESGSESGFEWLITATNCPRKQPPRGKILLGSEFEKSVRGFLSLVLCLWQGLVGRKQWVKMLGRRPTLLGNTRSDILPPTRSYLLALTTYNVSKLGVHQGINRLIRPMPRGSSHFPKPSVCSQTCNISAPTLNSWKLMGLS